MRDTKRCKNDPRTEPIGRFDRQTQNIVRRRYGGITDLDRYDRETILLYRCR